MRLPALLLACSSLMAGCITPFAVSGPSPVPLVSSVDIPRYMGDWYVVAHIPTWLDTKAHNSLENYRLLPDGRIAVMYTNRQGSFEGREKRLAPTGHVVPGSNGALWDMQFTWLQNLCCMGEYRIGHLEPDYSVAIIARSKLDYAWLFSRSPQMSDEALARYAAMLKGWGYDTSKLLRVPQQWPATATGSP